MSLSLQDYLLPGESFAFIFSDASGTNACVAMIELQKQLGKNQFQVFSNKNHYPQTLGHKVNKELPDFSKAPVDLVFTGTSHPESSGYFEIKSLQLARREGIKSISFIDHWVNFKLRFEGLSKDELPDEVWVIDERAASLAEAEGIPHEKIRIKGNPYHFLLEKYWISKFQDKEYLHTLGIPIGFFHILFAPDPLSIREIYKTTGFTETAALRHLLEVICNLKHVFLIIKAHPLQPAVEIVKVMQDYPGVRYFFVQNADNCELIKACDLVIGFYSNLLLEAKAIGKDVIRYFPGNEEGDLLKESSYFDAACKNVAELSVKILKAINEKCNFSERDKG